ncbi:hypothetical protein C056_02843, partial [Brucella melitensis F3/02]
MVSQIAKLQDDEIIFLFKYIYL